MKDISKHPLLTREQETILLRRVSEGDKLALGLVKSNLKLLVNIANLYKGQGLEVNELINEGNMGLIEVARRLILIKNQVY